MTIYTLYCDRCERDTTHKETTFESPVDIAVKEHPRNGTEVYCRDCNRGQSRADVPEGGVKGSATAKLEVSIPIEVDPDEMREGESIYEYVARLVREDGIEDVREALSAEDVESAYLEGQEGVWPNPSDGS